MSSPASPADLAFAALPKCPGDSFALSKYGSSDPLAPCVLYDVRDFDDAAVAVAVPAQNTTSSTAEVTLVQVTPSMCHNHRDGAVTAVKKLNADNNGRGLAIGYNRDHHVKFRLISIVGGNSLHTGNDPYSAAHEEILDSVLGSVTNAQYILGSCSFASAADKPTALRRRKNVISQVGPPGFYMDVEANPYVFGIHVNSDTYPLPALRALLFHLNSVGTPPSRQSVRVMYRTQSEFFRSTCRSAITAAEGEGFDVTAIEYDPDGDDDGDGTPNSQDVPFLESLADELCPRGNADAALPPAIFACVLNGEADAILARMRSNGCRSSLAWFTTATWGWAGDNMDVIPFFQGGGQWHKNFAYSDRFFSSGQDVLDVGLKEFGYSGSYDHVVSYAMPNLIAGLLEAFFRVEDLPDVGGTFADRYEVLRRAFVNFNAQTIFGPVAFDRYQRNNGRGAAGTQWIPRGSTSSTAAAAAKEAQAAGEGVEFILGCMSPLDQADAAITIPSPSGSACRPGHFINRTLIEVEPDLLGTKCSPCPADTFMAKDNTALQCASCPSGSSTEGDVGATACVEVKDNLTPPGIKAMGYIFVAISWSLAIAYIAWVVINKTDSVVKIGQPEFLLLVCAGAILSTSAIIPLSLAEAGAGEDTTGATRSCQAIPFLYSIGWVVMYSSLTAKSYRLTKVAEAAASMRRVKVEAKEMYRIIVAFLVLDIIVLICWQAISPLEYVRTEVSKSMNDATGVITIETVGQCTGNSLWKFLAPIIAIHVSLMIITNALLWRVRNMSDRYQEQKFVAIASIYICELLLLGVPILIAVQDSAAARYIVIAGVIFLTDTGVLSLIFIPKIKAQREGLPEGVSVAQSMTATRHVPSGLSNSVLIPTAPIVTSGPESRRGSDLSGNSRLNSNLSLIDENNDESPRQERRVAAKNMGDHESRMDLGAGHPRKLPGFTDAPESLETLMQNDPPVMDYVKSISQKLEDKDRPDSTTDEEEGGVIQNTDDFGSKELAEAGFH